MVVRRRQKAPPRLSSPAAVIAPTVGSIIGTGGGGGTGTTTRRRPVLPTLSRCRQPNPACSPTSTCGRCRPGRGPGAPGTTEERHPRPGLFHDDPHQDLPPQLDDAARLGNPG